MSIRIGDFCVFSKRFRNVLTENNAYLTIVIK